MKNNNYLLEDLLSTKIEMSYISRLLFIQMKWKIGEAIEQNQLFDYNNIGQTLKWSANEVERCHMFYKKNLDWDSFENGSHKGITWTKIRSDLKREQELIKN